MNPLPGLKATLGEALVEKIQSCKLLLVGAGGIGTELLKNLAMTGFKYVEVIDLDTIDTSNLNRQLLFRSQHVGMPKCTVSCQVATDMAVQCNNTNATYNAHHGNVCDNSKFNVQFVQRFDAVLNALDNVVARRRVNRLCLAAAVPLVEAGTTGYLGQVNVIDKESNVACYECKTQETQKVYPICTIRSTPSMPVHTIVWAKECYKLLFGEKAEESMLYEDPNGEEPSTFMQAVMDYRAAYQAKTTSIKLAQTVMEKLYVDEIQKQLDMGRYKTALKTPQVLPADLIQDGCQNMTQHAPTQQSSYKTTDIWQPLACVAEFAHVLQSAEPDTTLPAFDKDDTSAMRFVTAASNLRSHVFAIDPLQSFYSAKGIAGNIIPAIATTNAIAAGLQILQLFAILQCQLDNTSKTGHLIEYCSYVNIIRRPTRNGLVLTAPKLEPPNPRCYVCQKGEMSLTLNTDYWTLEDLLNRVIKKDMGFEEPSLMLGNDFIWEEGDDADTATFAKNLTKRLKDLPGGGIGHGTVLVIEDFSQDLNVDVTFTHKAVWEKEGDHVVTDEDYKFVMSGNKGAPGKPKEAQETNGNKKDEAAVEANGDDDAVVVVSHRKHSSDSNGQNEAKKRKVEITDEDVILIDD